MKKKILCTMMASVLTLGLVACGGSGSAESGGSAAGDGGELNLFIWTEYIPDSVIEEFEEQTGITVNMSTFSSNEDLLAKVKSETEGTYDIVVPSDYMVEQMADQGMLEEIDLDALENFDNIGDAYKNPSYDPNNTYSVPYRGGVAAIAVNTDLVESEVTSYDDLFGEEFEDSLVVLDDFRAIIGLTERSMGLSMNESDESKLAEVQEKLLSFKSNVKLYDSDSPKSAMISRDCKAGVMWSAEVALAMEEDPAIEVVFPSEGAYVFIDSLCITKGAKNYDNAIAFIDFILDAEVSAEISEEFPYLNPNTASLEVLGSDFVDNEAKNVPESVIEAGEYVSNLDTDTLAIYDEMWTKLKQ